MDGAQYHCIQLVSHGFSSMVMPAMWPGEELHLVRHLGVGGEKTHPREGGQLRRSSDHGPLHLLTLGTVHHRKALSDCRRHSQGTETARVRAHTHTHTDTYTQDGKAKNVRPCCPGLHTTRPSMIRHPVIHPSPS